MDDPFPVSVTPFPVSERVSAAELVERMAGTAFQARNLAQAAHIWDAMLREEVTIFLGLAGAWCPAGCDRSSPTSSRTGSSTAW